MEATMKLFMLIAVAALVTGGVYHTEVSRFFTNVTKASHSSTNSPSVAYSFNRMGKSGKGLMSGVGNALER